MSFLQTLRSKRTWIALGGAVLVLLALLSLGALLMVKGALPQEMQHNWVFVSYALAGLTGAWMGSQRAKGTLTTALTVGVLFLAVILLVSLLIFEGVPFSGNTWQFALCILAGSLLGGMMRAGKKGKPTRRKRSSAPRRIPVKSR